MYAFMSACVRVCPHVNMSICAHFLTLPWGDVTPVQAEIKSLSKALLREQQTWTHRRRARPHPTCYMNAYANLNAQDLEPEEENAALGAVGSRNHSRQRPTPDTGEQPAPPMPFPQKQAAENQICFRAYPLHLAPRSASALSYPDNFRNRSHSSVNLRFA